MGYKIRRRNDRKYFDHGWLKTYHTFSFGSYYDPHFMGFRDLRVINEDRVDPKRGFPLHDHQDMEIISLVLEGQLTHQDSTGNQSVLKPGEIQVMSAGKGIEHSEGNPQADHYTHFYQIWIVPDTKGVAPKYQQAHLPKKHNQWGLIASKDGKEHSLKIQQDTNLYYLSLEKGEKIEKILKPERYGWLQLLNGELSFNKEILHPGDGVAIEPSEAIALEAKTPAQLLFFDLK